MNTNTTPQEKSIQVVWPSGKSYRVRGEGDRLEILYVYDSTGNCRPASYNESPRPGDERQGIYFEWLPPTQEERREIEIEERAEIYQRRDVLCCDSHFVEELRDHEFPGFSIDDIEGVYTDTSEWTVQDCLDYLDEQGESPCVGDASPEEMREALTPFEADLPDNEEELRTAYLNAMDEEYIDGLDDLRDQCQDISNDNPREAYEWWRVSDWLADRLAEIGEITIRNDFGEWWGRTCTGQGMIMDGTLQRIAAKYVD